MSELQIQLFGSPSILQKQEPVTGFVSSKATALVYYLAATNRMHSRDSLAALLWADVPEARAKKNLRDILSNLRKVMGSYLDITRQTVALTTLNASVDVSQFDALMSASGQDTLSQQRATDLTHAAALQTGEFLEGFYVSDAPIYEEWVLTERERLGQLGLQVFNQLITSSMQSGNYTEGINYALRSLALAPLEEETHRQLMSIYAANGQYAAALEEYERCCQILYDELGAEPSAETTALFESIQNRQENPFTQQINDDHLLPFVGRADELAEINRLLASSGCRLLTLVGLGGVGKTRLARQAAIRNQHRFLDGTYLIEAGVQYSIEQFVTELANTLGLSLDLLTDEDAASQLLDYLRAKSMLLIIDNAEFLKPSPLTEMVAVSNSQSHRAGEANSSLDLLHMISASAPAVQLIATSRERLDLRSEWVFDVGGLSSSTLSPQHEGRPSNSVLVHGRIEPTISKSGVSKSGVSKSELLKSDAFQLFLHRGRQAWGDFPQSDDELTQTDLAAIGSICQLMDGMPLAIELAASWVSMLSCKEIQDEVTQGMDLLASTARDLPERHRSLHAVFDHSWQMISATEQDVLEKLSLFTGGFDRKAAQQIAGASLPTLQNLMHHSFLTRTGKERFCLHNLLQQYAYQRLSERPADLGEIKERHARYFSDLLLQYQDAFLGEQTALVSKLIDEEGDNVRAAFEWTIADGQIALLEQMVDGIYQIYVARSWLAEGIGRLRHAVEQLGKLSDLAKENEHPKNEAVWGKLQIRLGWLLQLSGQHEDAQIHLDHGLHWAASGDEPTKKEQVEKALCLLGQAHMHFELASYGDAQEVGQQCLDLYRQQRNQIGESRALYILGKIQLAVGEYRAARQNLSQALSLAQVRNLRSTEAECLGVLGRVCWNQGDNGAAQGYFEEALTIFQLPQMTNQLSKARILNELGFVSWSQGRYAQAEEYHIQARQIFHRFGNRQGEGTTLSHLGRVAERYKSYADAARLYEQAVILNREIQDRRGEAISIANLAFVAYRQSDYARSEDEFAQCRDLCQAIGFRRYEALAIACLGLLACFRNDCTTAVKLARDAIDLAQQIKDPIMEAYGWIHLGYALTAEGKWDEAALAYERSLLLRRGAEDTERLLDPLAGLAYIALQQNDLDTAQRHTDEILMRLNAHTLPSALFPAQIHYVCYRVLSQNDEPEAAHYLRVTEMKLQEYKKLTSLRGNQNGYLGEPILHGEI